MNLASLIRFKRSSTAWNQVFYYPPRTSFKTYVRELVQEEPLFTPVLDALPLIGNTREFGSVFWNICRQNSPLPNETMLLTLIAYLNYRIEKRH